MCLCVFRIRLQGLGQSFDGFLRLTGVYEGDAHIVVVHSGIPRIPVSTQTDGLLIEFAGLFRISHRGIEPTQILIQGRVFGSQIKRFLIGLYSLLMLVQFGVSVSDVGPKRRLLIIQFQGGVENGQSLFIFPPIEKLQSLIHIQPDFGSGLLTSARVLSVCLHLFDLFISQFKEEWTAQPSLKGEINQSLLTPPTSGGLHALRESTLVALFFGDDTVGALSGYSSVKVLTFGVGLHRVVSCHFHAFDPDSNALDWIALWVCDRSSDIADLGISLSHQQGCKKSE